jgi:xanthine dehydrogenase accessory factor
MRDPGAHMAVARDGRFAGSLSGGCIEAAVVAEALAALAEGRARMTRFGAGSRFLDIRLPCGGGLNVHFWPISDAALIGAVQAAIAVRQPFTLRLPLAEGEAVLIPAYHRVSVDTAAQQLFVGHWPAPRLIIIGHGAASIALARQAQAIRAEVVLASPDPEILRQVQPFAGALVRLHRRDEDFPVASDAWSAIVFLFHDHDWEEHLLLAALAQPHCYIGAMGGRTAHAKRCEALCAAGVSAAQIARLRAPIGLFHSARDPDTLALSALAEIIRDYHAACAAGQASQTAADSL